MDRVKKILEFLEKTPNDNFLRHALALEYIKIDDDDKAQHLFTQILNESPNYIGSYYHLGKLLERKGETQEAIKRYEQGMNEAKKADDQHAFNELQAAYEDLVY